MSDENKQSNIENIESTENTAPQGAENKALQDTENVASQDIAAGDVKNKQQLSAKRWFLLLVFAIVVPALLIPVLNIVVDPFSAFGDPIFDWYSYGMTNNPKVAKYTYLDNHRGQYDAFIIGPSGSSGFTAGTLEKYTGLRWYNTFHYGANMDYTRKLADYLINNHNPKEMLLCLPVVSAVSYSPRIIGITTQQPFKQNWRMPFLFANPKYSVAKIEASGVKSYVQGGNDIFVQETGEYNKTRRDAEPISGIDNYLIAYPEFIDAKYWNPGLKYIEECYEAVLEIAQKCENKGIKLTIVAPPMTAGEVASYKVEQVQDFYERIAEISGFWEFISTSVSHEPRYFYDKTHFRNDIGKSMIAKIYGDESVYIPDDFGTWVTGDNVRDVIFESFTNNEPPAPEDYTKDMPVLMYHNLSEEESTSSTTVSKGRFDEQMQALRDAGFTPVSPEEVSGYVKTGTPLPDKPIMITFDDGYMSNYSLAYPILQNYNFKATIFVIGVSFGKTTYKETGQPITPHFGADEATIMTDSGLISIQSHTYDLHNVEAFDDPFRTGVMRMMSESEEEYIAVLRNDYAKMQALLEDTGGIKALSFPYGRASVLSTILFNELGCEMTFTIKEGINTLVKGMPQSLLELKRFNVTDDLTGEELITKITG